MIPSLTPNAGTLCLNKGEVFFFFFSAATVRSRGERFSMPYGMLLTGRPGVEAKKTLEQGIGLKGWEISNK